MKIATNDGRLHLADCAHVYSSPAITPVLAVEWAQHTDLISVNPSQYDDASMALIAKYAHAGIYTKANHDTDASLAEAEYAHHWDGVALKRKANLQYHPPVFIMQPDSAWRQKHQADLQTLERAHPWCSWFFKDTARASYDIGGPPVIPGTHTPVSRDQWERLEQANFALWDASVGYQLACINGLATDTLAAFQPCVGMIEGAWGLLDETLPNSAAWSQLGDLAWSAQGGGWTPWLYAKLRNIDGAFADQARRLSVASAYLWDRGSLLYLFGGVEQSAPSWVTREYLRSCYRPAIGLPGAVPADWHSYVRPEGTYVKGYSSGRVIVNPTSTPITTRLRDGSAHRVGATDATIIRRTSTGWETIL